MKHYWSWRWKNRPGPWWLGRSMTKDEELEMLKSYKDHLEIHRKEVEEELKTVDERIREITEGLAK